MARKLNYFVINKPCKVLSQFSDEAGNLGLGSVYKIPKGVYPVGRLDLDSEGLLILSDDKRLNDRLLNPKNSHERTYWVEVEGVPEEGSLQQLEAGVDIKVGGKAHRTLPAKVEILNDVTLEEREPPVNRVKHPVTSWVSVTLTEGKNRQVRKMTAKIGHPTLRLIRVAIEDLELGDLAPGEMVMISPKVIYRKLRLNP